MEVITDFNAMVDWWLMLWLIYVIYSLLLFIYGALTGWPKFLWFLVGLGIYPILLAYMKIFQSPHVQLAYMVVVAVVLYIMSTESDFAFPLLVLFVIHSVLFIYVRAFRESIVLELTTLVVAILVQVAKIVIKMVRPRLPSNAYVDGASASNGPAEQPPAWWSSYSVDDALRGSLEQGLEMGVFSYSCNGEEQDECVICLCEYQERDSLVALPRCQHSFHVDCIRRWLKCQLRCPICNSWPFQELGSHAGKDVAGNMREGTLGSEDNV